jgi:hypothetical protein
MMDSRIMRWTGHVTLMERRGLIQDLGGKVRRKETNRKNKT